MPVAMKRETKYPLSGLTHARGVLVATKVFPRGKPGLSGLQFAPGKTRAPPTLSKANLRQWSNYYLGLVEYYVAVLNGLQFDLDLAAGPQERQQQQERFGRILDQFAAALIDRPNADPANPPQLVWPLAGLYWFRYRFSSGTLDLTIFFECDPDHYLVTNASVDVSLEVEIMRKALMAKPPPSSPPISSYLSISSSSPCP